LTAAGARPNDRFAAEVDDDEETAMPDVPAMNEMLGADAPKNRGKWGPDDELGALNYLDAKEVLRGAQHIRTGDVFTLPIRMSFRYVAAPLKVVGGSGAPVNPIAIR
jgi:kynurenine formamidase